MIALNVAIVVKAFLGDVLVNVEDLNNLNQFFNIKNK